jgi:hypothetical protein
MQLIDGACQKHRSLVFLAGLLLIKEYATYVKFHTGCELYLLLLLLFIRMCHLVFRAGELVRGNMSSYVTYAN